MSTVEPPKQEASQAPAKRQNPFEALRAASELRQREKALEQVKRLPKADFMMEAPLCPTRVRNSDGAGAVPSLAAIRDATAELSEAELATTRKIEVATEKLVREEPASGKPSDPYEKLARAHQSFGKVDPKPAVLRPTTVKAGAGPSRLLPPPRYTEATREAGIARAMVFASAIAGYYDMDDAELAGIRDTLRATEIAKLGVLVRSYEFAANHVALMSDDKLARRAALERNAVLKAFFDEHGMSDEVPERTNAVDWTVSAPTETGSKGRKGKR